jgi:hypothetical protein
MKWFKADPNPVTYPPSPPVGMEIDAYCLTSFWWFNWRLRISSSFTNDTLTTIRHSGGDLIQQNSDLMIVNHQEVYISRTDVWTIDELLYNRLGNKFKLSLTEDQYAWPRANEYVKSHSIAPVEIGSGN